MNLNDEKVVKNRGLTFDEEKENIIYIYFLHQNIKYFLFLDK